jgi:hypothetical protein
MYIISEFHSHDELCQYITADALNKSTESLLHGVYFPDYYRWKGKSITVFQAAVFPFKENLLHGLISPTVQTIVHSRRRESHSKQMHVISPSLFEWNHAAITWCVPLQGCPKSEYRLTCVRMQWVHWTARFVHSLLSAVATRDLLCLRCLVSANEL